MGMQIDPVPYNSVRHNGVDVGKLDYLGPVDLLDACRVNRTSLRVCATILAARRIQRHYFFVDRALSVPNATDNGL
jgi:hypothetical protein